MDIEKIKKITDFLTGYYTAKELKDIKEDLKDCRPKKVLHCRIIGRPLIPERNETLEKAIDKMNGFFGNQFIHRYLSPALTGACLLSFISQDLKQILLYNSALIFTKAVIYCKGNQETERRRAIKKDYLANLVTSDGEEDWDFDSGWDID